MVLFAVSSARSRFRTENRLLKTIRLGAGVALLFGVIASSVDAQQSANARRAAVRTATTGAAFDDPDEMDGLSRELWEFARHTPYEAAVRHAKRAQARTRAQQRQAGAQVALPTGWRLAPAGAQVDVGRLPYEAVSSGGRIVVLNTGYYSAGAEEPEVSVVGLTRSSGRVEKTLRVASLYPSAAATANAVYVSGGSSDSIFQLDRQLDVVRAFALPSYAGPVAAIDSTRLAVAYFTAPDSAGATGPGRVAILNTATGTLSGEVAGGYFPSAMLVLRNRLYVALVGEHRVLVFDVSGASPKLLHSVSSGKAPQSLCTDGDRVYVVNSASDEVAALSGDDDRVAARYAVRFPGSIGANVRFGSAPTSCAVSGTHLYVTAAGMNAVAVFDRAAASGSTPAEPLGLIPTAWYPTKVLVVNGRVAILSAKGVRARRPNPDGPQAVADVRHSGPDYVLTLLRGSLALLPDSTIVPRLAAWTRDVADGAPMYSATDGLRLPIRHVFYVVRENRSYDQVLGDLGRGDGDSTLTLFGQSITPIAHQLAKEFATLDHFYADGEISVLGHSFTTSGYASPFLEWLGNTSYAGRYRGYPFGTAPGVYSPAYLWDALEAKRVSYRVYGEPYFLFTRLYRLITDTYGADSPLARRFRAHAMALADSTDRGARFTALGLPVAGQSATPAGAEALLANAAFTDKLSQIFTGDQSLAHAIATDRRFHAGVVEWLTHYMLGYPTWNLGFSDLDRVALWKQDFEAAVKANGVPQFSYLWLPNDHTAGANASYPNPFQLVAQNDAALGQLVETISHSPIWRQSLIIVEEDDAQNGPDHVDATRTVALLAGPYVRRGVVVPDRYDQISALRTVELLLGLDPLNLSDAVAVPMFGALTGTPDARPFTPVAPSSHLMPEDQDRLQALKK